MKEKLAIFLVWRLPREATNAERKLRGLPVPWTSALADVEVRERPVF